MDCGSACLRMVCSHYGKKLSNAALNRLCQVTRVGSTLYDVNGAAQVLGFETYCLLITAENLQSAPLPCVLHWQSNHFVVLYAIRSNGYYIADPAQGKYKVSGSELMQKWALKEDADGGIALILTPTEEFYTLQTEESTSLSWKDLVGYLRTRRKLIIKLLFCIAATTGVQFCVPFLAQMVVDRGIRASSTRLVTLIIIAQGTLLLSRLLFDFFRSFILMNIGARFNISVLKRFLVKLMKLPMSFFDSRFTGDIMQRMNDQRRIETFLTGTSLNVLFAAFFFVAYAAVLAAYNTIIFFVFIASVFVYGLWIFVFLKKRRRLDYERFRFMSQNQNAMVQILQGMQDIKLNNCENQKRIEWESIQVNIFRFNLSNLKINQVQQSGASVINEGRNLVITLLSAFAVIHGQLTIGAMIAVQYIIGQLNSPVDQFIGFVQQFQDSKISLERLNEIHGMDDEQSAFKDKENNIPAKAGILLNNISFRYSSQSDDFVFENLSLIIPHGKTTAIVGLSGSGKTTLLKLLLHFYPLHSGEIIVGNIPLEDLDFKVWRGLCGVVMQEGFLYSDTIANNIAVGDRRYDPLKMRKAIRIANLEEFVYGLPGGLQYKIGPDGNGISQGQKQRILIARAVYKEPDYLFFDEATNSLDSNNESIIMGNLSEFLTDKTVVVIAHRLSTVKNADQIIVLDKGRIIEKGSHDELIRLKGKYFSLVKDQLEL